MASKRDIGAGAGKTKGGASKAPKAGGAGRDGIGGRPQVANLVYEALETELGGVEIYRTALECVRNEDLREEWTKYLAQTEEHVVVLTRACVELGLDPDRDTPGRQVVRHVGKSLVKAMQLALGSCPPEAAEIVAAECVVQAETKDHANWSLIGEVGKELSGHDAEVLRGAYESCEDEEDEHLYHSQGWMRELAMQSLGLQAELPPPEEERDVHTAAEAAEARAGR